MKPDLIIENAKIITYWVETLVNIISDKYEYSHYSHSIDEKVHKSPMWVFGNLITGENDKKTYSAGDGDTYGGYPQLIDDSSSMVDDNATLDNIDVEHLLNNNTQETGAVSPTSVEGNDTPPPPPPLTLYNKNSVDEAASRIRDIDFL